ncbi:hypothetical protein [Streptomyces sp. NPDC093109]|uniref:hypothetical protein n=1 Tax=Streptomyces sp. NPDC093109 TaxID=3154977 RepID=UPI00344F972D
MTHKRETPDPRRRRFRPWHWLTPRGSRTLILGICAAVGGLAGAVRAVADGAGILSVLVLFMIGALGVLLAIAYIVAYSREN